MHSGIQYVHRPSTPGAAYETARLVMRQFRAMHGEVFIYNVSVQKNPYTWEPCFMFSFNPRSEQADPESEEAIG